MLRRLILVCALSAPYLHAAAQGPGNGQGFPVEVVATASEYRPRSVKISRPGHSYTNCSGSTFYFGRFESYGPSGSFSGTADSNTSCATTYTPPSESTLTAKDRRVNYTIVRGDHSLYLLSCTQRWKPSRTARGLSALAGALGAGGGNDQADTRERQEQIEARRGAWSECPAFNIGARYMLTINNISDVRLQASAGNAIKLDYLSSAELPQPEAASVTEAATTMAGSSPPPNQCPADTSIFDSGREWKGWTSGEKYIYLSGFVDGQSNTYLTMTADLSSERRETLRKQLFLFYPAEVISEVMTDLYKDPSNTFINHSAMVYIARDKLAGKEIEPMLRYSREHDIECAGRIR